MQALIDFEGWRKWRGFSDSTGTASPAGSTATVRPLSQVGNGTLGKVLSASSTLARSGGMQGPGRALGENDIRADSSGSGSGVDGLDPGAVSDGTPRGGVYDKSPDGSF